MDSDPFMPTGNCRPASTRTTLPLLCSPRSKEDFYSPRYVRIPVHSKLRSIPSSPLPSADEPKRVRSQLSPRSAHGSWMMHVHPHDALADRNLSTWMRHYHAGLTECRSPFPGAG